MLKRILNLTEIAAVICLSGFLFWPNAISSITLITLLSIQIIAQRNQILIPRKYSWLGLPVLGVALVWAAFGFASDATREIQLWATWIAAVVYFYHSEYKRLFKTGFVFMSVIQTLVFLTWLTFSETLPSTNYAQEVRDAIQAVFHIHPTYMSAMWLWAALLSLANHDRLRNLRYLSCIILVLGALFAGGKMPFLAFILVLLAYYLIRYRRNRAQLLLTLSGITVIFVAALMTPVLQSRFDEFRSVDVNFKQGQLLSSTEVRLGVWMCTIHSIKSHWLTGVGLGHTRETLESCYYSYDQSEFFETEFNTHNQFLHYWLAGGIFGLACFLLPFGWLIRQSIQKRNMLLFLFMIYALLLFQTENYLLRQHGMMWWSFFASILLFESEELPTSFSSTPSS